MIRCILRKLIEGIGVVLGFFFTILFYIFGFLVYFLFLVVVMHWKLLFFFWGWIMTDEGKCIKCYGSGTREVVSDSGFLHQTSTIGECEYCKGSGKYMGLGKYVKIC